ncbi:sigma-70 family RNA polymerase sigma factor [Hyphomonas johnsonii]|uniref:RNA polymerase sigma factor n=1 Tax=Hyphomonas johnsonii MHS-2 TaxID=1280950 RepID=A0A059FNM4_9PROT|nr:sigma-70 family RNA polymerase sigma factor [Hyphomonas johnsonii]KCZ92249.1 ECF subfamily RNA polymerase sigma factor [Hyphomonas johnsonii MHS-2]
MMTDHGPSLSGLAFADELERLIPELRAFARGLCRHTDLADDLVQDTCLKAWSAIDSFRTGAAMRPWLFRILRNEFYQYSRRAWRSTPLEPDHAEQVLVAPECLESKSDFRIMQRAIDALPPQQRDALLLVVAAGFTYQEAGEICDCSDGTIKSRVSRARDAVVHQMTQAGMGRGQPQPSEGAGWTGDLDGMIAYIERLADSPGRVA